jgi:hypothetical protein
MPTSLEPPELQTVTQPLHPATTTFWQSLTISSISATGFDSATTMCFLLSHSSPSRPAWQGKASSLPSAGFPALVVDYREAGLD